MTRRKIVHLSDTHWCHREFNVGSGDILIHSGDAELVSDSKVDEFALWMQEQDFTHKIFVPGNHDVYVEEAPEDSSRIFKHRGVDMLLDNEILIDGLKFYGMPHTPQFGSWAFMGDREYMKENVQKIPMDVDILVTHGPPQYILDNPGRGPAGCEMLAHKVVAAQPILHLFGHIHEGYGTQTFMNTLFINSAVCPAYLDRVDKNAMVILMEDNKVTDFYPLEDV